MHGGRSVGAWASISVGAGYSIGVLLGSCRGLLTVNRYGMVVRGPTKRNMTMAILQNDADQYGKAGARVGMKLFGLWHVGSFIVNTDIPSSLSRIRERTSNNSVINTLRNTLHLT